MALLTRLVWLSKRPTQNGNPNLGTEVREYIVVGTRVRATSCLFTADKAIYGELWLLTSVTPAPALRGELQQAIIMDRKS